MVICPECGTANTDSAKFCKGCGSPLKVQKPIVNNNVQPNSSNASSDNKKLLLICGTIIVCIAIIAAAFIMISDNGGSSDSNAYNNQEETVVPDSSSNDVKGSISSSDDASNKVSQSSSDIYIKYCDFYTGSSLSDKSYCSANIGTEHYGETYKISVLYSRDGSNLNDGATATKTVDEEGFLHIYTSNAFKYYPDKATVDIYDSNGDFLTEETYYLEETSGQQKFGH